LLKSAPIVGLNESENLLCSKFWIIDVFPTPESPIATTLTKHFFSPLLIYGDAATSKVGSSVLSMFDFSIKNK
tara:strand:+ start:665 stop:883 length:219 start_codon:yes stop_codon:yes gene_type:complete